MGDIVVVGSANIDYVVRVTKLPAPGETVPGGDLVTTFGGKGANAAVAAARLGGNVKLIGCVGSDSAGDQYLEHLVEQRVDTSQVLRSERPTGSALILVDDSAENMIAVAPGANHALCAADVESARELINSAAVVLCQFEVPLECVRHAIVAANQANVPVVLNPSPFRADFDWTGLQIDYLVLNRGEADGLAGTADTSADEVKSVGNFRNVIITRGASSSVYCDEAGAGEIAAFQVQCVDTVGAGDTFAGALAVAISEGKLLPDAIRFANAAAALATTRMGAQASMPTRQEVTQLLSGA